MRRKWCLGCSPFYPASKIRTDAKARFRALACAVFFALRPPFLSSAQKVVAVPKSMITAGVPYELFTATALTSRSTPTCALLLKAILRPFMFLKLTITGFTPYRFFICRATAFVRLGTTLAITAASTAPPTLTWAKRFDSIRCLLISLSFLKSPRTMFVLPMSTARSIKLGKL